MEEQFEGTPEELTFHRAEEAALSLGYCYLATHWGVSAYQLPDQPEEAVMISKHGLIFPYDKDVFYLDAPREYPVPGMEPAAWIQEKDPTGEIRKEVIKKRYRLNQIGAGSRIENTPGLNRYRQELRQTRIETDMERLEQQRDSYCRIVENETVYPGTGDEGIRNLEHFALEIFTARIIETAIIRNDESCSYEEAIREARQFIRFLAAERNRYLFSQKPVEAILSDEQ